MQFYLMVLNKYIAGPYDSVDEAEEAIKNDPDLLKIKNSPILRDKVHICAEDEEDTKDDDRPCRICGGYIHTSIDCEEFVKEQKGNV